MSPGEKPLALAPLAREGARAEQRAGRWTFSSPAGLCLLARPTKVPTRKLVDPRFLRSLLKGEAATTDLEAVWTLSAEGRRVYEVVQLFPYSLLTPEGSPSARGYELRDPRGRVVAYTDGSGRLVAPALHVLVPGVGETVRVIARGFKTHLAFVAPDGRPVADAFFSRAGLVAGAYRLAWIRPGLDRPIAEAVGRGLVLASLWTRA